ncbi:hypothetical protein EDC01DRAFT_681975 [Geopyxis carbonaria]|nr:hypothetical protein EDC01DRAFT_681975 [Geopyxis carbonaria]
MQQSLLSDAALALSRILTFHRISHGFFGGFAILACGGTHRESKDLDVLVSAPKSTITSLLTTARGYLEIPQAREDYVAFFWQPPTDTTAMVLVEMFCGHAGTAAFPLAKHTVNLGRSYVPILTSEYLLRGKLNAAAARHKSGDAQDIQFLCATYPLELRAALAAPGRMVDKKLVAAAVKRHPCLAKALEKVGALGGVRARGITAKASFGLRAKRAGDVVPPGVWGVHRGLGWELPSPVVDASRTQVYSY